MGLKDLKDIVCPFVEHHVLNKEFDIDEHVNVSQFSLKQLPQIFEMMKKTNVSGKSGWVALISTNYPLVLRLVSMSTGETTNDIEKLPIEDFTGLALKVFEVNSQVFFHKIVPMIEGQTELFQGMTKDTGLEVSKG